MTTTKNCPYCDELISINAIKCKHCGSMLSHSPGGNLDNFSFVKLSLAERYNIISEIGRGGMATVYKAIQKNLQRTVALKVIHQNLVHDQEFIQRFHTEARISASLNHPNLTAIYDEGTENGIHYIAMEYLDGEDLQKIIKQQGKLTEEYAIFIISNVADALDYIHRKGLVHRDIKSSNIFLTSENRVILTDFGIARALAGSKLSQTGGVIGTPEYMSPEQAEGKTVTGSSDLFSLGVVLFECLTGKLPFTGDSPVATIYKIINTPAPPLSNYLTSVPKWLQSVTTKVLEKNPKNRFRSGQEFAYNLNKVSPPRNPISPKTRKIQKVEIEKTATQKKNNIKNIAGIPHQIKHKIIYIIAGLTVFLLLTISAVLFEVFKPAADIPGNIIDDKWSLLSEKEQNRILELINKGQELYDQGKFIEPPGRSALDYYEEVLILHPTNNQATQRKNSIFWELYSIAEIKLKSGEIKEALQISTSLKRAFPDKESILMALYSGDETPKLLFAAGDLLAKNKLSDAEYEIIYEKLSKVLQREKDNILAEEFLEQLKNIYVKKAEELYKAKNYSAALSLFSLLNSRFGKDAVNIQQYSDCKNKLEAASTILVPSVIGLDRSAAESKLLAAGFTVKVLSGASTPEYQNKIFRQIPDPNMRKRRGDIIKIFVGE